MGEKRLILLFQAQHDAIGIDAVALWFRCVPGSGTHDTITLFSMACEAYDVFC
jgi:hypothetical protein